MRPVHIPDEVTRLKKYDKADPERRRLAKDIEEKHGGAGVYNVDLRADYLLDDPAWKYDKVPEVSNGMNVADFIDPDIDAKLAKLEEEEERLEAEGYYESDEGIEDDEEVKVLRQADEIREQHALIRNEARLRKSLKNRAMLPRKKMKKPLADLEDHLDRLGHDTEALQLRARARAPSRGRSLSRRDSQAAEDADAMDVDKSAKERLRSRSKSRAPSTNRREDGVTDATARTKAERQAKLGQRRMNRNARQGEADRHVPASMPKHLVSHFRYSLRRSTTFTDCNFSSWASVASERAHIDNLWATIMSFNRRGKAILDWLNSCRGRRAWESTVLLLGIVDDIHRGTHTSLIRWSCHSCAREQRRTAKKEEVYLDNLSETYRDVLACIAPGIGAKRGSCCSSADG